MFYVTKYQNVNDFKQINQQRIARWISYKIKGIIISYSCSYFYSRFHELGSQCISSDETLNHFTWSSWWNAEVLKTAAMLRTVHVPAHTRPQSPPIMIQVIRVVDKSKGAILFCTNEWKYTVCVCACLCERERVYGDQLPLICWIKNVWNEWYDPGYPSEASAFDYRLIWKGWWQTWRGAVRLSDSSPDVHS